MKDGLLFYKSLTLRFHTNRRRPWSFAIAYLEPNSFILLTLKSQAPMKMIHISPMYPSQSIKFACEMGPACRRLFALNSPLHNNQLIMFWYNPVSYTNSRIVTQHTMVILTFLRSSVVKSNVSQLSVGKYKTASNLTNRYWDWFWTDKKQTDRWMEAKTMPKLHTCDFVRNKKKSNYNKIWDLL